MFAMPAWAQLNALSDEDMRANAGQGGMYLTGEFSVNRDGGPLWRTPASNNPSTWAAGERSCAVSGASLPQSCGVRIAVRTQSSGGWYLLDNLKGTYSFEGLTVRTKLVNSGFGTDGAAFNRDVLEVGLPSTLKVSDGSASLAIGNQVTWQNISPGAPGANPNFRQNNLVSVVFSGTLNTQGSLLIFPR
jgi:hypothetical protein